MKKSVYLETTVVSYLCAKPSRDLLIAARQETTREMWSSLAAHFDPHVSALVFQEAGSGDADQARKRLEAIAGMPMLELDEEARSLAEKIIVGNGVPSAYPEDALHIALAAVNGLDLLLTWNFAHLNNPFTRMMVRQIVENHGYRCPEICSPDELMEVTP
jgi:hypothetical protein